MRATIEEFKAWSGVRMEDARLGVFLNDAARSVVRDGVGESHDDFNQLHRLKTLLILPGDAVTDWSSISARSMSGISTQYAGGSSGENPRSVIREQYTSLLFSIIGMGHRLA